ncbi:hypothetical protein TREMEDRAFT_65263 [Tremella mesenterica DSM 1558]|uniref:uncharacterized protein n=1 Tax=Tremella mesenterica (strain ATCC 24925 / CBS 8224 / DSM 1558 / NBRC 9311 / NRRL Y-6157 / RJB 2259-6 / UBC 559-6) TaxID=578456 RepID=UPI00032C20F3|nr:uncharacterized protein TREMEDRAFT_65263 [Tremella mesenterica DSM 1558]EIW66855.1 hypothetical protein TREMEDRAFT_65263 [Tremella mesenterica DSM 1558]
MIPQTNIDAILSPFHTFNDLKPFKHVSTSQRREGIEGLHPFHLGIVRRQGNTIGVSKDTSQTTRKMINKPTKKQDERRQAALNILRLLKKFVCTPVKRQYSYVDKDTVDYSFFLNHQGRDMTAAEGTIYRGEETEKIGYSKKGNGSGMRFVGMAMAVAIGYAPTSNLIHHAVGEGPARKDRIIVIFYTCRHVESLLGKQEGGKVVSGPLEGVDSDDLIIFDEDEISEETDYEEVIE